MQYQNQKHGECHRAFKTSNYEEHKNINPDRMKGTCRWALEHPKFQALRDSPRNDLLWISADPGCGKSVLIKSLVDHDLNDTITDQHALGSICYFFFKDNEVQDSLATALCALLHQLFAQQPRLIRHAIPAWEENGEKIQKEINELWKILHNAADDPEARSIICLLDALDECCDADRRLLIPLLCEFYERSSTNISGSGWLKFLVTSRPYDDIEGAFQQIPSFLPSIRLRAEEENDQIHQEINWVVRQRVNDLARDLKLMSETQERIERKLLDMDHRTYLWLYLAIDDIRTTLKNSLRPDDESVELLPSSVEDAYERILERVPKNQNEFVRKILLIVVGARRALTTGELSLALGIIRSTSTPESLTDLKVRKDHLETHIRHWCGLFLFLNHSRIYLIHQTAKEFLLGRGDMEVIASGRWKACLKRTDVEVEMASLCVLYLCLVEFNHPDWHVYILFGLPSKQADESDDGMNGQIIQWPTKVDQRKFFTYCAEHWASHFDGECEVADKNILRKIICLYDVENDLFQCWFSIFLLSKPRNRMAHLLLVRRKMFDISTNQTVWLERFDPWSELLQQHVIAITGHVVILDHLYRRRTFKLDARDRRDKTALIWAAEQGNEAIVDWLVQKGADVNAPVQNNDDALQMASIFGHEKVVQILIDAGADMNAQDQHYGSPLHGASKFGHEKVVQILIDAGADVNAEGGTYCYALQEASLNGHEKVVQMLIDAGADVNARGGHCGYALQAASWNGDENVVQMLINAGADVNAEEEKFVNALQAASMKGHEKIVRMLINAGADVNVRSVNAGNDVTALHAASKAGHEKVVQMLINAGADVNTQGDHGTALQLASQYGYDMQTLIDAGVGVNAQGDYGTALQLASQCGHEKVVQMLINAGVNVNTQGDYGTALQSASQCGHEKVVQMLVNSGADVNLKRPLHAASRDGHEKVVQILIDAGADVNAQEDYGTALQLASRYGRGRVMQMLINAGAVRGEN
jgi:ankyrin repeat protein